MLGDILYAMEFDKNGDHLAVGDQGGRVMIFKRHAGKEVGTKFSEISFVISSSAVLEVTLLADITDVTSTRSRRVYANAHDFNINSISNNSDGETFLSGDDLRINVWNLEVRDQCFNIIDMKPKDMEDLTEVITSAEFHPFHCNLLAYSSSRGFIRLVDLRKSALCDHNVKILQDKGSHGSKTFLSEIIASISDMKYAMDGRHILTRDYMTLKLWDTHMETSPVATYKIHEHLHPKLPKLYTNDAIFDNNHLRVFSCGAGNEDGITLEVKIDPNRKPASQATSRPRRSSFSNLARGFYRQGQDLSSENEISCNLKSKLLHLAWHPTQNLIACSVGSSLFMYHA
ncbi:hypothetical protein K7X08_003913 [Anisodus acutangulus]|uniref:Serine/threonine-protein phosphatase 2A 55 kDa regulatory subunit B n=1 Tax=Anisodus acutangulus TaxID=402998 RepID=A0A9Q1MGJ0_9SOLA|nr:hypothetical protein K7X08_003913 [Anisodus acutangulus]